MKKFLASLLVVVLLVSLVASLVACSSKDLRGLTYIDENGQEQTINIKKTSNVDEVSASVLALASKQINASALNSLLVSLSASGSVQGTQNEKAFNLNGNISATVGLAIPDTLTGLKMSEILAGSKAYIGAEAKGTVPKSLGLMLDDEDTTFIDLTDTIELNESLGLYLDNSVLYAKAQFTEGAAAALPDFAAIIDNLNGKTQKANLGLFLGLIDNYVKPDDIAEVAKELDSEATSYKSIIEKIVNGIDEDEDDDDDDEATTDEAAAAEEPAFVLDYATVKKIVSALNIQITETNKSVVTFSATINKDSIAALNEAFDDNDVEEVKKEDIEFDGTITLDFSIDAATITLTATDVFDIDEDPTAANPKYGTVAISASQVSVNLTISTTGEVPTLPDEEKASAGTLDLMGLITAIMGIVSA